MGTIVNGNTYYTGKGVRNYNPMMTALGGLGTDANRQESQKAEQMKLAGYNVIYDDYVPQQQSGGFFGGLSNALASVDPSTAISRELTNVYQPVEKAITAGVEDVSKALSTDDAKKAMAVGAAYFLPGVGAQLGQQLVAQGLITGAAAPYATAIGTALTQAGVGVAQGQPFDTALTNATVNAVTSTGAPNVAQYISKLGATPEVANAVTSVGASGLATAAKGGSAADIEKNMTGALAGSAVTGLTGDKLSGAVVGGAVTGGPTGALVGAAGAAGAPKPEETEKTISGTGLKGVGSTPTKDTDSFGVKADYTFPGQPGLGFTENVPTTGGLGISADPNLILPESLRAYKTAPSEMKAGEDGALVPRYTSGSAYVVPESLQQYLEEGEPIGQKFVSEPQTYTTQTQDKTGSDLSIYSGKSAQRQTGGEGQTTQLGTTLQAPFYPSTTLGQALTGYRGAGEIEGQKTGKPRQDVWNEESLRLKDALGL